MNFGDIFRGFFGNPRRFDRNWDTAPPANRSGCPDCDDDNVENPYGNDQPQDRSGLFRSFPSNGGDDDNHHFSFHFSESDDMMKHFDEMFRSFDEVFKSMGIADFSPQGRVPFDQYPGHPGQGEREGSLRDRMLKQPVSRTTEPQPKEIPSSRPDTSPPHPFRGGLWTPFNWGTRQTPSQDKIDKDLDGEVKPGDLGKLFPAVKPKSGDMEVYRQQPHRSYSPGGSVYRGVSVHTYRSADGKAEERRTIRDGEGNEETTITRAIGDQVHSVTTHQEGDTGREKKVENYTNMDERDKTDFDRKWNTPSRGPGPDIFKDDDGLDDKSVLRNLFGFGFPGFGKS